MDTKYDIYVRHKPGNTVYCVFHGFLWCEENMLLMETKVDLMFLRWLQVDLHNIILTYELYVASFTLYQSCWNTEFWLHWRQWVSQFFKQQSNAI